MPVAELGPDDGTSAGPFGLSPSARLAAFLGRQPRWRVTVLGLALLGGLWIIDRSTAPDVSFLVFYLAPVLLLTWFVGRRAGVLVSPASAVLWFLDDVLTGPAPAKTRASPLRFSAIASSGKWKRTSGAGRVRTT